MVLRSLLILALATLTACGTPQDRCRAKATRDLRVVVDLIEDLQVDIDRGYRLEERTNPTIGIALCSGNNDNSLFCFGNRTSTRKVPVAIDIPAEREKLAALEIKRRELAARAQRELAACEAQFPES
ncbi:MAG: hypothetical protein KJN93_02050 [Alphaproteobacteria bacterium]|nr:hypothetical protein [Alphaproteobacteria bacterium]NNF23746.1 hypothetical protein [Paracoccaceae bacterium]